MADMQVINPKYKFTQKKNNMKIKLKFTFDGCPNNSPTPKMKILAAFLASNREFIRETRLLQKYPHSISVFSFNPFIYCTHENIYNMFILLQKYPQNTHIC